MDAPTDSYSVSEARQLEKRPLRSIDTMAKAGCQPAFANAVVFRGAVRGQWPARRDALLETFLRAHVAGEDALAQPDALRRHLDQLVVVDEFNGDFQAHQVRRHEANGFVGA